MTTPEATPARTDRRRVRLDSEGTDGLSLTIESRSWGLRCSVFRGEPRAGATVTSRWRGDRAAMTTNSGGTSAEARIAVETAQRLCKASHREVSCSVALPSDAGDESVQAAADLTTTAALHLAEQRLALAREDPGGVLAALEGPATSALERRIETLFRTPLQQVIDAHPAATERCVLIFAPLYLTNACLNDCIYCGFRSTLDVDRVKLSPGEALAEAVALAERGHRTLDLVSGELPTDVFVDYVAEVCRRILADSRIEGVHLNLGALSDAQYRRLHAAGARGYHLYQETYDARVYGEAHRKGPKRDMGHRLEGTRRAARAGFQRLGLGILLGLGDPARDLARLARHAQLLIQEFPDCRIGFSLPRIQAAGQSSGVLERARIADDTFMKSILFLSSEFPAADITVTTRESLEMRDRLLPLGVTKVSAGASTAPGGYRRSRRPAASQFSIRDERSLEQVAGRIRELGRVPTVR